MNNAKPAIIGLAVALAAVIGYAVYLHQGPVKNITTENQRLLSENDQLKAASEKLSSTHKAKLDSGTQREEELLSKTAAQEETIAKISEEKRLVELELEKMVLQARREKERIEAELQSKVGGLENQLVQKQLDLKVSHEEAQQLKADLEKIKADHQSELADKIKFTEELQRKSSELEEVVLRARKENEALEANLRLTIKSLEDQLAERARELQSSRNETQELKAASDEAAAAYKAELAEKVQLVEELKRKSGELEEMLSRLKKETDVLAADLQSTVTGLENQLAQWDSELQTSRKEVQKLRDTIAALEAGNQALNQKNETMNQQLLASENQVAGLQKKIEEQQAQLLQVGQTDKARMEQMALLEAERDQLQQKNSELNTQLAESQSRIQTIAAETATKDQKIMQQMASLEAERDQLQQKNSELNTQLAESQSRIQATAAETATKDQKIMQQMASLEAERDQLQQKNNDLKTQLAEAQTRIATISDDSVSKDQKISEMEVEHQQLMNRIATLDIGKAELARLKDALKNQLGMTQSQIESLSMETTAKEELLRTKEEQINSMKKAYQELSKQFEQQIAEKEIKISNLENKLNIQLMDKILFASGKADITPDGNRVLKSLATELQKMNGFEISVIGHTDNKLLRPKLQKVFYDNLGLSVARASAVSRKLRQMGVSPANLSATGYSMYRPVASNDTREGRQQNRRVEIMLEPLR